MEKESEDIDRQLGSIKTVSAQENVPPAVADAVLVSSCKMPAESKKVEELDFNKINDEGPITVDALIDGMKNMGFQASSICEAVRIINDMVF